MKKKTTKKGKKKPKLTKEKSVQIEKPSKYLKPFEYNINVRTDSECKITLLTYYIDLPETPWFKGIYADDPDKINPKELLDFHHGAKSERECEGYDIKARSQVDKASRLSEPRYDYHPLNDDQE